MKLLNLIQGKMAWALGVSVVLLSLLAGFVLFGSAPEDESLFNNLLVFTLVNLNIMALLVLIVMVGRNVVKLMFERRRGILGAKLRSRLMGSFVLIALVPMTLSFFVASGLINEAVELFFSTHVESAVTSSLSIARQHVAGVKLSVKSTGERLREDILRHNEAGIPSVARLEELRMLNDLFSIKVVDSNGVVIEESSHPTAQVESFQEPPLSADAIREALRGESAVRVEERGAGQFIRWYGVLGGRILVASYRMDPEIVHAQRIVNESFQEYEGLKTLKHPLKSNFLLTLALFNLITIFGAIWVAFFVSKQITGPIQKLAEGTRSVARGNYDFELPPMRDDEVGFLVGSFNQMLRDLRSSRDAAERGRLLIDTILSNLAVGVISLDTSSRVTAVNSAAGALLEIDHINYEEGAPLSELLRVDDYESILPIIDAMRSDDASVGSAVAEVEMRVHTGGRELLVVCTAGRIVGAEGLSLGYVLLFDDITELSRSQHLAAWRDVARRIAHEIKNPLTPLQLSAQRLERLLKNTPVSESVDDCTRSIVEHVEIIKRLANEFSEYGRMPMARFVSTDLAALVRATVANFTAQYPNVAFTLSGNERVPEMLVDPEQIRGVLINILNNAVAAVATHGEVNGCPEVRVSIFFDRKARRAVLEICDNGPGISPADKNRIFEPYFTTKRGGTGLGLAIVSSVISEHQGEIRVFDNQPHGAKFVITLPQAPQPGTVRRLSSTTA
jgi:two-component system nitrogen regulation sensor histidine kinase NtrY